MVIVSTRQKQRVSSRNLPNARSRSVGYGIVGGLFYLGVTRFAPKATAGIMEIVEKVVGGTFETVFNIREEFVKSNQRVREAKEAISGD